MTTAPKIHEIFVEDEEGALGHMPFEVAHALLRLGWHESWFAALAALPEGHEERRESHQSLAKEARETWNVLAMPWASGPRGGQRGRDVVENVRSLTRAAAKHCAAMRIYKEKDGKSTVELQKPAEEPYKEFESARSTLSNLHGTLAHVLVERIVEVVWAAGWHAANTVANIDDSNEEGEEEEEHEEEEEEGEDGDDEEEDEEDEEDRFGEDYPGSSDDPVEDMRHLLEAFHNLFHSDEPCRGVRCSLASESEGVPALETISRVPGTWGDAGLNSVRLVLPDWSGCSDAVDSTAGDFLLKAEALNLRVILELPAVPGKAYEDWLRALSRSVHPMKCVRGVALPRIQDTFRAAGLVSALRQGGLTQDRCACFLQLPAGKIEECQEKLYKSDLDTEAAQLPLWISDGHVLMEAPAHVQLPDKPESPQVILDAASALSEEHKHLDLVSSWSLTIPSPLPKLPPGAKEIELIQEFAQRMVASMEVAARGWFFDSWNAKGEQSLQACLERGWINLAATEQIMYPHGSHTTSLVYLHGFTCSGYDYLKEPYFVYRPKPKKKKKAKSKEEDEEDEMEPFPGLKVVYPTAPKRAITCYQGEILHAWHDYITDHEGDLEDELSLEDLQETTARIHALLDAEAALVGGKNVFLGGASQGCGTALHIALTYKGDLGGVIGAMGHLLTCTPITPEWLAKKIPIFVYNGLDDTTMKWEEWVKATWQRLQDAKADIRIVLDEGVDHGENEEAWMRSFLTDVMKTAAPISVIGIKLVSLCPRY